MSTEQKDTAGWGGRYARAETWAEFDALPRGVKRAYWFAPFNYTAVGAVEAFRRGEDMRTATARILDGFEGDVRRESRALYGVEQRGWLA